MRLKLKFLFLCAFLVWPLGSNAIMELPQSTAFFDLEMPMRCSVGDFKEQELASTVVVRPQDFTVRLVSQSDMLPRYQVNSFSSRKQPLNVVLQNLLTEAGIEVRVSEGTYPVVSVKALKGELSNVLEKLAQESGVFYVYDAESKILTVRSKTQMLIQLPRNKYVMMAVMDVISGGHFVPTAVDWENYQITLDGTRDELNKLRRLMATFIKDKYLLLARMNLYEINALMPTSHWHQVISDFGTSRFALSQKGMAGILLLFKPAVDVLQFVAKTMENYQVAPLAHGQMLVPSGWRVRFNLGECAMNRPYEKLSVVLSSKMQGKKVSKNSLTIDTEPGEVVSFDFTSALDQEAAVIGVPVPNKPDMELLLTLKFSYINLIKKGE